MIFIEFILCISLLINRLRSEDMIKLAELKYKNKDSVVSNDFKKSGAAIVTFELLRVKHNNVIDFERTLTKTSTIKGSTFILYNVARLQRLLASFDEHVSTGYYNALPEYSEIDFGLLREEVCLLFHFKIYLQILCCFCYFHFKLFFFQCIVHYVVAYLIFVHLLLFI